jgi:micrococcal nuclease
MVRSRAVIVAFVATVLAGSSAAGWWIGHTAHGSTSATVVRTLDGDTIEVRFASGATDTIRVLGVDTPETHHPTKPVQCFGPEAAAYTRDRLLGRSVRLEDDVETHDTYGRRLAYVIIDGERFDDELLRLGYARLLVIPPNEMHARAMLEAELDARRDGRGLWAAC